MVEIHMCNALVLALALVKLKCASKFNIAIDTRVAQMYFYRYRLSLTTLAFLVHVCVRASKSVCMRACGC